MLRRPFIIYSSLVSHDLFGTRPVLALTPLQCPEGRFGEELGTEVTIIVLEVFASFSSDQATAGNRVTLQTMIRF